MIYTIGVIALMCIYIVYAGYTNMFYSSIYGFYTHKAMVYGLLAIAASVTWPVTMPVIALYKIGRYYGTK